MFEIEEYSKRYRDLFYSLMLDYGMEANFKEHAQSTMDAICQWDSEMFCESVKWNVIYEE